MSLITRAHLAHLDVGFVVIFTPSERYDKPKPYFMKIHQFVPWKLTINSLFKWLNSIKSRKAAPKSGLGNSCFEDYAATTLLKKSLIDDFS